MSSKPYVLVASCWLLVAINLQQPAPLALLVSYLLYPKYHSLFSFQFSWLLQLDFYPAINVSINATTSKTISTQNSNALTTRIFFRQWNVDDSSILNSEIGWVIESVIMYSTTRNVHTTLRKTEHRLISLQSTNHKARRNLHNPAFWWEKNQRPYTRLSWQID